MKRETRKLLIALSVVAVMAMCLLLIWLPEKREVQEDIQPSPATDSGTVIAPLSGKLNRVKISWDTGEQLEYSVHETDGSEQYDVLNGVAGAEYQDRYLRAVATLGTKLTADRIITEVKDYAPFGLDNPRVQITFFSDSNGETILQLGRETADGASVYLKSNMSADVYVETLLNARHFLKPYSEYLRIGILPADWVWKGGYNTVLDKLTRFEYKTGEDMVLILPVSGNRLSEGKRPVYRMQVPVKATVSDEAIYKSFAEALLTLTKSANKVSDAVNQPEAYGLDEPLAILTVESEQDRCVLTFGQAPGKEMLYLSSSNDGALYQLTTVDKSSLEFHLVELLAPVFNCETVPEHIVWEDETGSYSVGFLSETDLEGGKQITKLINELEFAGIAEAEFDKADLRMELNVENGEKIVFEGQHINSRQCLVCINGEDTGLYCKASDLNRLGDWIKGKAKEEQIG